jgi:Mn2+/Fe2+ NRAMP family transporter
MNSTDASDFKAMSTPAAVVSQSTSRRIGARARLWIVRLCRFGLAALFLFTAAAKLAILKAFAANVAELLSASGFNYSRWMWPVTIGVIVTEIVTAILLLVPRTVRVGALLAGLLLVGFAGYALYYVYARHGEPLECGCFGGIIASQLGVKTALRNLLLLIPVIVLLVAYRRGNSKGRTLKPAET